MKPIRNSAKAIIIKDGKLLAIEKADLNGPWYLLPGGGQHPGETLHQALARECKEEANAAVRIGELRFIREYIGRNHEFAAEDAETHQIEFMFACGLVNPGEIGAGHEPDEGQLNVVWLDLEHLLRYRLYPLSLRDQLKNPANTGFPVYLGDVN